MTCVVAPANDASRFCFSIAVRQLPESRRLQGFEAGRHRTNKVAVSNNFPLAFPILIVAIMKNCLLSLRRIFLLFFVFFASHSFAQNGFAVSGKVTDAAGGPVEGVTVQESGTRNTAVTGKDGSFTLNASSGRATLQVSSVGYESQQVSVNNQSSLNVAQQRQNARHAKRQRKEGTKVFLSSLKQDDGVNQYPSFLLKKSVRCSFFSFAALRGNAFTQSAFRPSRGTYCGTPAAIAR